MLYKVTIKDEATLISKADELGLDKAEFQACMDSYKYLEHIKQDMSEGTMAGVMGTPGNIIRNNKTMEVKLVSGAQPFENFKRIIDEIIQ